MHSVRSIPFKFIREMSVHELVLYGQLMGKQHLLAILALCGFGYCQAQPAFTIDCARSHLLSSIPSDPGPSDAIALYAIWWPISTNFFSLASPNVRGGIAAVQGSTITLDIYGSDQPMQLPGVQPVANEFQDWYGIVGPLAAGTYTLSTRFHAIDASGIVTDVCPAQDSSLLVGLQSGPTVLATAVEYHYAALDHYFVTSDPAEIAALDGGLFPGWLRSGLSFKIYEPQGSDGRGVPVCRFYGLPSAGLDSHFYTANGEECTGLFRFFKDAWQLESLDVFEAGLPHSITGACRPSTVPVFRLWNARSDNDHRFTTDATVRVQMIARGYLSEGWGTQGVAMCVPQ